MLNEPVLILNRSWMPLQVANIKRSITLLFKGHAEVVCPETFRTFNFFQWKEVSTDQSPGKFITTPNFRMILPEVLVLRNFNRTIKRQLRFNRKNIIKRDNQTCQYCGKRLVLSECTLEHIVPVSKGGENSWDNVVIACTGCNKKKADKSLEQAGMKLIRPPAKPRASVSVMPEISTLKSTWHPFLGKKETAQYVTS